MRFPRSELPVMEVSTGAVVVVQEPNLLSTVLGSCVAVTFWSPRTRLGAMCHSVLPQPGVKKEDDEPLRYLDAAIPHMLQRFELAGVVRTEIVAKVFGGGEVMAISSGVRRRGPSVGTLNVEKAFVVLDGAGVEVAAWDVGGNRGRKILFNTVTGEVLLQRLSKPGPGAR